MSIIDIASFDFKTDGQGYRIPFTKDEITAYQSELSKMVQELAANESILAKKASYKEEPSYIPSVKQSAYSIKTRHRMFEAQKRSLDNPDSEIKKKYEAMKLKALGTTNDAEIAANEKAKLLAEKVKGLKVNISLANNTPKAKRQKTQSTVASTSSTMETI